MKINCKSLWLLEISYTSESDLKETITKIRSDIDRIMKNPDIKNYDVHYISDMLPPPYGNSEVSITEDEVSITEDGVLNDK